MIYIFKTPIQNGKKYYYILDTCNFNKLLLIIMSKQIIYYISKFVFLVLSNSYILIYLIKKLNEYH